jgi:biopolymer transport protein ExbD
MKRFSERHQLSTLSELNVTPLLDLAFVLLIIFMITTPLMENSSSLVLPTHKAGPGAAEHPDVEMISIDKDAMVLVDKSPVEISAMEATIAGMKASRPNLEVVVRAHKDLPVQKLVDVMDAIKRGGVTKVGLAGTAPEEN